jgi:hypothetical protein
MDESKLDRLWLNVFRGSNERQRRHLAALKALELGWGGVSKVCRMTGMSHNTVDRGVDELEQGKNVQGDRVRVAGGGRKKIVDKDPEIKDNIERILRDNTVGDPMLFLLWTNKSLNNISKELKKEKHSISRYTVRRFLLEHGYTLQSNKKSKEHANSPRRDSQFRYINEMVGKFSGKNQPVISVDAKKKELVGSFKNAGKRWLKAGEAEEVNVYDFESLAEGKAVPYGIYEIARNKGFVNVGISSDTAEFAVNSIRRWWKNIGQKNYLQAKELLICSDCGGSNGNRNKLWAYHLQKFAEENGIKITVCHYPPGTSKWNRIEHKMFSFISMNWKGKPLVSYEVIINLIRGTKTKKGLRIRAKLDKRKYEKGKKISEEEFKKINRTRHSTNPEWNYTIQAKREPVSATAP